MEGYISKQSAIEALEKERDYLAKNNMLGAEHILVHHALRVIDEIPPADVVPVVRCRDCDSWNKDDTYGYESLGNLVCSCSIWSTEDTATRIFTGPDEFCSRGERRDEDG